MPRTRTLAVLISTIFVFIACTSDASPAAVPTPGVGTTGTTTGLDTPETSGASNTERVTITFAAEEADRATYTALIRQFEQDNPAIHIQFVAIESIVKPVPNANGGKELNIFQTMREVMSGADTAEMPASAEGIQRGWVRDLTPFMDADATFDRPDFYPGVLEAVGQDEHTHAASLAAHPTAVL